MQIWKELAAGGAHTPELHVVAALPPPHPTAFDDHDDGTTDGDCGDAGHCPPTATGTPEK
jgi:hypothetical protein